MLILGHGMAGERSWVISGAGVPPPVPETRTGTVPEPWFRAEVRPGDGYATRTSRTIRFFISGFSVSDFNFCFGCALAAL